jgi:hypothetical protein
MCNAFNHPPGCKCGWGPRDKLGALPGVGFEWTHALKSYESFVNPNARCPACDKRVYFYRSPDNGRVYFDKLGPPWPKHPCMDIPRSKQIDPIQVHLQSFLMACPPPDAEGWRPLLPRSIRREFATFYIQVEHPNFPGKYLTLTLPLAGCCPIYWRLRSDAPPQHVQISLLDMGKYGDIQVWSHLMPVAQTLDEARHLKNVMAEVFKAR